jgi:hypothetical protein
MVWLPDAEAVPLHGPTIGDEPWIPGQGFAPGGFYYPAPPFAEGSAAERSRGGVGNAGQTAATSPPSGPGLPTGGGTTTAPTVPVDVPEPSGALVLVGGLAGIGWVRRRVTAP